MHYRTRVAALAETFTETQLVDIAPVCHGTGAPRPTLPLPRDLARERVDGGRSSQSNPLPQLSDASSHGSLVRHTITDVPPPANHRQYTITTIYVPFSSLSRSCVLGCVFTLAQGLPCSPSRDALLAKEQGCGEVGRIEGQDILV